MPSISDSPQKERKVARQTPQDAGVDHAVIAGDRDLHPGTVDFEKYFRFLEEYWSLFDWREAVRRCWRPGRFHDIRL
ncbi:MAG: hypothetical protein HYR49_07020 [Gammaproteobacteria bacterium]|nr:hypothetical protein [Gammaproteobacteria bacterium]